MECNTIERAIKTETGTRTASLAGLCQKHKPQHHHMKVDNREIVRISRKDKQGAKMVFHCVY